MLPVVPFEVLVPFVVVVGILTFGTISGIVVRRLITDWYDRNGERTLAHAERLLLEVAEGRRPDVELRSWLGALRVDRLRAFLKAADRLREIEPSVADWLAGSGIGRFLGEHGLAGDDFGLFARVVGRGGRWSRVMVAEVLGRLRLSDGFDALAEAVSDSDEEVAHAAAEALARSDTTWAAAVILDRIGTGDRINDSRLAAQLESMECSMTDLLRDALEADSAARRFWAVTLIGQKKEYDLVEAVKPHLESPDANVRAAASECIGELAVPLTDYWLADRLVDDAWFVRSHAARSLGEMGSAWAAEPLAEMLESGEWWVRASCVDALAELGEAAWDAVEQKLFSEDRFARNSAVEALARSGWTSPTAERAASGSANAGRMLTAFGLSGGLGYLENALFTVDEDAVPYLLALLREIGDDATYGRLKAAAETYPEELREAAEETADFLRLAPGDKQEVLTVSGGGV